MRKFKYGEDEGIKPLSDFQLVQLGIRPRKLFINRGMFRKSPEEKLRLKKLKKEHKALLIRQGFDPKQRLNLNDPQIIRFAVD